MTTNALTPEHSLTPSDLDRDRKLELLLDELVAVPVGDELPADFSARVVERRPWAPWEVSRPSSWTVPAAVGLGLLGGSLGLALTPLWSLGPGTAFTVWAELIAVAFGRPAAALASASSSCFTTTARSSGFVMATCCCVATTALASPRCCR